MSTAVKVLRGLGAVGAVAAVVAGTVDIGAADVGGVSAASDADLLYTLQPQSSACPILTCGFTCRCGQ